MLVDKAASFVNNAVRLYDAIECSRSFLRLMCGI